MVAHPLRSDAVRRRSVRYLAALMCLSAIVLSGCMTGERPTLTEVASASGEIADPATADLLDRLEAGADATFTATYEITNNFGPITRTATVVQAPGGRRSVTVGDVRFVIDGSTERTCDLASGAPCEDRVDDAAISDLQVTHQFYRRSAGDRLRTDALRTVAPTEAYEAEIAGQVAQCVSVSVSGGSKVYCVLDAGVLAQYQGPDVLIVLTGYDDQPDEIAFELPG